MAGSLSPIVSRLVHGEACAQLFSKRFRGRGSLFSIVTHLVWRRLKLVSRCRSILREPDLSPICPPFVSLVFRLLVPWDCMIPGFSPSCLPLVFHPNRCDDGKTKSRVCNSCSERAGDFCSSPIDLRNIANMMAFSFHLGIATICLGSTVVELSSASNGPQPHGVTGAELQVQYCRMLRDTSDPSKLDTEFIQPLGRRCGEFLGPCVPCANGAAKPTSQPASRPINRTCLLVFAEPA